MRWRCRETVLAVAVAADFAQFGARLLISPVVPDTVAAFSVSKGAVGLVLTGLWAVFALAQFPSGVLADRYGERRVVLAALGATTARSLLLSLSPTSLAFAGAAVLLGAGAGLYFSVGTSLLTRLYEETGGPLGLHSAGGPVAGLVLPVVAAAIAVRYGWRRVFLLGAGIAAVVCALAARRVRTTEPARPDRPLLAGLSPATVRRLLGRPAVAYVTAIAVVGMYTFRALLSFFPTFLVEHHGLPRGLANALFSLVFVLSRSYPFCR